MDLKNIYQFQIIRSSVWISNNSKKIESKPKKLDANSIKSCLNSTIIALKKQVHIERFKQKRQWSQEFNSMATDYRWAQVG